MHGVNYSSSSLVRRSARDRKKPVTYKPLMSAQPKSKTGNPRGKTRKPTQTVKSFKPPQYTKMQIRRYQNQKTARKSILNSKRRSVVPPRSFAQNMLWALPRSPPKNTLWPILPKKTKDMFRRIPEFRPLIQNKDAKKRAENKAKRNLKTARLKQEAKLRTQGQAVSRAARAQRKPERLAASLKVQKNTAMKRMTRKKIRMDSNKLANLLAKM